MDVSIIIVNYNTQNLLTNCIESIINNTLNINYEIIVSDNGSVDDSVITIKNKFPNVIIIENKKNLGFGAANNRALEIAKGKYVFYLNSDTILLNNSIKLFFDYYEKNGISQNIGALGCNLLNPDKTIGHSYGIFEKPEYINNKIKMIINDFFMISIFSIKKIFFNKNFPTLESNNSNNKMIGNVDCIVGADLFLLNNNDAKFDERYFMYVEEMDLEYRLSLKGYNRLLIDGPEIIHLDGASAKKENDYVNREKQFSRINWRLSTITFYKKFGSSNIKIFIWKSILFLIWLNPFLFNSTKKYFKKLFII